MIRFQIPFVVVGLIAVGLLPEPSRAWFDQTHLAVARAAGYQHWYNAAAADVAKIKAGPIEDKNHFYNNDRNAEVTAKTVLGQAGRYNNPKDDEGHLYGAIVSSLREFRKARAAGQYAEYSEAQLKAFRSGDRRNDANRVMQTIAARMSDQEILAVADYIAGLH